MRPARADVLAGCALLLAVIGYFLPFVAGSKTFFQVDVAFMDHPIRVHAASMLRRGLLPLWSDDLLAGFPLFAEGQAAVLYPPSWLYLVLPPESALNAFLILHYLILGASGYVMLRSRTASVLAALFGALTLVFSAFMLVEHVLLGFLSVIAWCPLLLVAGDRALRSARPAWWHATAGGLVALMQLAGDPLGALVAVSLYVGFVACAEPAVGGWRPRWGARLTTMVVPIALGSTIAAVQMLPTYAFLQESTRATTLRGGPSASQFVPPEMALTVAFPNYFGSSSERWVGPAFPGWEESALGFAGWVPLFLLPFGAARSNRFWIVAAGVSVLLSVSTFHPLSRHLWSLPPLNLFRWPARFLAWYPIAAAVLASRGFDRLVDETRGGPARARARQLAAAGLGFALLVLFALSRSGFVTHHPGLPSSSIEDILRVRDRDAACFAAIWAVLLAAAALRHRGRLGQRSMAVVLFGGLLAGAVAQPGPEGVPPEVYRRTPDTARFLRERLGAHARVLALAPWDYPANPTDATRLAQAAERLSPNQHLLYGVRSVGQFDLGNTTTLRHGHDALWPPRPEIVDLLAVDAIVTPFDIAHFAGFLRERGDPLADALPILLSGAFQRCFTGAALVYCRERPLARAFLAADPSLSALLDGQRGVALGSARLTGDGAGRVTIEVDALRPAWAVLADTDDPGWWATVDGRTAPIVRAGGLVRAVAVDAGRHVVELRYRPRLLLAGAVTSLAGVILAAVLVTGHGRRAPAGPLRETSGL